MNREPWLTKKELAAELKVSPSTIDRLNLPHLRVGHQNRYLMSEVIAHLRGGDLPSNVVPMERRAA